MFSLKSRDVASTSSSRSRKISNCWPFSRNRRRPVCVSDTRRRCTNCPTNSIRRTSIAPSKWCTGCRVLLLSLHADTRRTLRCTAHHHWPFSGFVRRALGVVYIQQYFVALLSPGAIMTFLFISCSLFSKENYNFEVDIGLVYNPKLGLVYNPSYHGSAANVTHSKSKTTVYILKGHVTCVGWMFVYRADKDKQQLIIEIENYSTLLDAANKAKVGNNNNNNNNNNIIMILITYYIGSRKYNIHPTVEFNLSNVSNTRGNIYIYIYIYIYIWIAVNTYAL